MYHNYFFLKRLAGDLDSLLKGAVLEECFSQNKEELILGFDTSEGDFFIRANLQPTIGLLHFSRNFHRAKKNSVSLFEEVTHQEVEHVTVFENERSFSIKFKNQKALIFKMHGSRSNILLANEQQITQIFRGSLETDLSISLPDLNRSLPKTYEDFEALNGIQAFPHIGKEAIEFFHLKTESIPKQWTKLPIVIKEISEGSIYIYQNERQLPKLRLFLIPDEPIIHQSVDAIEASRFYFELFIRTYDLETHRSQLIIKTLSGIKRQLAYINKSENRLHELIHIKGYNQLADVVMANLHEFKGGKTEVILHGFYTQESIVVKVKHGQTAQSFAETLYRKGKNQSLEINKLQENIAVKKSELNRLESLLESLKECQDIRSLKALEPTKKEKELTEIVPYHSFHYSGYDILVGKNATSNDYLTQKVASKNDLWLHARDTPGSHVIIRYQAGKNYPTDVIEKAASLAAWYSKRKQDTLCPVIYTEKKNVRKIKGTPPGQVRIDKEKIVMIQPSIDI